MAPDTESAPHSHESSLEVRTPPRDENKPPLASPIIRQPRALEEKAPPPKEEYQRIYIPCYGYAMCRKEEGQGPGCAGATLRHHRAFGLRHWIMLWATILYTIVGTFLFYYAEAPNERTALVDSHQALEKSFAELAVKLKGIAPTNTSMEDTLREAYISWLKIDGKYTWSTYDKLAGNIDGETKYVWTWGSSLFYAITVYTTIGYGSIAPVTVAGKILTIIYSLILVPICLAVVRDFAQACLVGFTRVYARILIQIRERRGCPVGEKESITTPTLVIGAIAAVYILSCGVYVHYLDMLYGAPDTGMDWPHSLNFAYISISTVGLGDIMPNNASFHPTLMILFFFGLPLMRLWNRRNLLAWENMVFGTSEAVHVKIDRAFGYPTPAEKKALKEARQKKEDEEDRTSVCTETEEEKEERIRQEMINNFTVRSIATFAKSRSDVYNGDFGRVTIHKNDL